MSSDKLTRLDIAREAGVSVSAVSRALNDSGYVAKEKKEHILEIANRYGYMPSPLARALKEKKTRQLLFFCEDLTGAYYNQMYHGMVRRAGERGYQVIAVLDETNFQAVRTLLADGVLFCNETIARAYVKSVGKNYVFPAVTASFDPACLFDKPIPSVIVDNEKVIDTMIDYLMARGHKKIGMALPFNSSYAHIRFKHWKKRMTLEIGEECMHYLLDVNQDSGTAENRSNSRDDFACEIEGFKYFDLFSRGKAAARIYKESKFKATAIICFNDDMAFGMMEELKNLGLHVPEDVSIMGIDGVFGRDRFQPKLTTVSIFPERQGAMCVDAIIDMLEGKKFKRINYLNFKILEGESVAGLRR